MRAACYDGRAPPVHPHGRGDNAQIAGVVSVAAGSPPRAWGQCRHRRINRCRGRFTPTGVGTITRRRGVRVGDSVHPHGRGDNRSCGINSGSVSGSPPRAWGQCRRPAAVTTPDRFTPTGVGTMYATASTSPPVAVHPHGRGDNTDYYLVALRRNGSPPRAWGQSEQQQAPYDHPRFTPTGVGTIARGDVVVCNDSVHPHGRGDNLIAPQVGALSVGSPPRAWGQ